MKRYTGEFSSQFDTILKKIEALEKYTTKHGICESILLTVVTRFSYEATPCLSETVDNVCELIEFVNTFNDDADDEYVKKAYYYTYKYQPTNSVLLFCFVYELDFLNELNDALNEIQKQIIDYIAMEMP